MAISDWPLSTAIFDKNEDVTSRCRKVMSLLMSKMSLSPDQVTEGSYNGYYKFAFNHNLGVYAYLNGDNFQVCCATKAADGKWTKHQGTNWYDFISVPVDPNKYVDYTGAGLRIKQFGNVTVYVSVTLTNSSENRSSTWWTFTATDYFTNKTTKGLYQGFYAVLVNEETKVYDQCSLTVYGGTQFPTNFHLVAVPCIIKNDFFYGHIGSSTCIYWLNVASSIGKVIKLGSQTFECLGNNIYTRRS